MVLIVDDKSKDAEIDRATEVIEMKRKYLMENYTWMSKEERMDKKFWLNECEKNREKLINERVGKTTKRVPSLKVPGPMPDLEKQLLIDLIESV